MYATLQEKVEAVESKELTIEEFEKAIHDLFWKKHIERDASKTIKGHIPDS